MVEVEPGVWEHERIDAHLTVPVRQIRPPVEVGACRTHKPLLNPHVEKHLEPQTSLDL